MELSVDTIQQITLGIAIYAAIFSTISIIFNIWFALKKHKPFIKAELSEGSLVGKNYENPNKYLFFKASNNSTRNITLNTIGLEVKKTKFQIPYPTTTQNFPCELKDGKSFSCWSTIEQVAEGLKKERFSGIVKIKGFFTDAVGNKYYSKPYKFNVDKSLYEKTKDE